VGLLGSSSRRAISRWTVIVAVSFACALILGVIGIRSFSWRDSATAENKAQPKSPSQEADSASGKQLYADYCAPCHGDTGDGKGLAARYLYPKPRNFRESKFRLVTRVNLVPSDEDILRVLTRGMPGSAMMPFAHLSESDRLALVRYVRELTRTGILEQQRAEQGEGVDQGQLARDVDQLLQPAEPVKVPSDLPAYGPESIARGSQLYREGGCVSCHGQTGKGDGVQEQRDDLGMPIRPRDLTRGIFKGSHEPQQLFARIALGMPGTPMPASPKLSATEIGDLTNFALSLSTPEIRAKAEQRRTELVARRVDGTLPDEAPESEWSAAGSVPIVVSPLWWRDYAEPDLHVAAIHDGKSVAIRLTWQDAQRDDRPVRPQDFEDMAAVQLFKGDREPFLGMGATDKSVDAWLWRASWQAGVTGYADVDTVHPNMAVDLYPFEQPGNGPRRHGIERQPREFLAAQAAGNLQADPARAFTGSNLQAKGFGTLTMRPRVSQLVRARGQWKDGRWTVVLRRALAVDADSGISLASGDRVSIAFAIWDGAARDRDGQKLISIWHDLRLE
jgi:mono/diheme cytochrome c family protein